MVRVVIGEIGKEVMFVLALFFFGYLEFFDIFLYIRICICVYNI